MRFVPAKRRMPTCWVNHRNGGRIVKEADIFPRPNGRLAAKLLIFDTSASMKRFWREVLGRPDLGRGCLGAVNALAQEVEEVGVKNPRPRFMRGDARYFCVIGLCAKYLHTEIIAHEAVHAGFCYAKRLGRNLFGGATGFDEEMIAYPTGLIVSAISNYLHKNKLWR